MKPAATHSRVERRLTTPRAAAIAGLLFALLFTASLVPIRIAIPDGPLADAEWSRAQVRNIELAIGLTPFAGIAFLWFMGVVRDRLGAQEDQFFATVFFGSGLLFVAMIFAASALAGSTLTLLPQLSDTAEMSDAFLLGRAAMFQIMNVYAIKMAGVFMLSLSTIWMRTGVMPRFFAFVTIALALVLLVAINFSLWIVLLFPAWVACISLTILYLNLRRRAGTGADGLDPG